MSNFVPTWEGRDRAIRRASGFHTFGHPVATFINTQTGNLKLAQTLSGRATIDYNSGVHLHFASVTAVASSQRLNRKGLSPRLVFVTP